MGSENALLQFEPGLMIWTIVVFLLTLLVLRRIAWGPLLAALDEREQRIQDELSRAERASREAEEAIAKALEDSAQARREGEQMRKQALADAEKIRERMVEDAKAESQRVVDQGLKRIEAEQRAALQQIRHEAADLAIKAASKLVRSSMTEAEQRAIVDDFLKDLPRQSVQ